MDDIAAHLSHRYRVICPDTLGRGLSQWSPEPQREYCLAFYVKLAESLVNQLGLERFHWLGTSMGGSIGTLAAAGALRGRIRRLVLAATNCGLGAVPGSFGAMASLATPMRYYSPTYFDRTAAISYGGMTGRDLSMRRRMMAERHRHPPSAYGYSMQLLGTIGWSNTGLPSASRGYQTGIGTPKKRWREISQSPDRPPTQFS